MLEELLQPYALGLLGNLFSELAQKLVYFKKAVIQQFDSSALLL